MTKVETLQDEFCSDDTFEEMNEERTNKRMLVNIGDSKSEQKNETTEQVIGETLSSISGIETENILSFNWRWKCASGCGNKGN